MKAIIRSLIFISMASCLSGCYPMPTENDYSTIPGTNNPDITRHKPTSTLQGLNL